MVSTFTSQHGFVVAVTGMHGFLQERINTVNPLGGETEFLANETIKVNPNGGKKEESP